MKPVLETIAILNAKRKPVVPKDDDYLVCPNCGHYPIHLIPGKPSLTWKQKGAKASCPKCIYEENLWED